MKNPRLTLKLKREKPVLARHPWIFSGAIDRLDPVNDGDLVDIVNSGGQFIARGYFNSKSQIACRILAWKDEPIDEEFFRRRILAAISFRKSLKLDACRLVNSENDLLPGLIVDIYHKQVVVQFLTLGMESKKEMLVQILNETLNPDGIFERSDVETREKEGLPQKTGTLSGKEPPEFLEIGENGLKFLVDIRRGHKTGFYLDQRENRNEVATLVSRLGSTDRFQVLNAFSYTGAFGVYAAKASPMAHVLHIDSSEESLSLARHNFEINGIAAQNECMAGNVFEKLRLFRDQGKQFDLIILDPPKFAFTQSQLNAACRGYKDLNLLAFKLLKQNGHLVTFSCSGAVHPDLFQKVIFEASADAGRSAQIIKKLGHPADHPVLLSFPEGEYLKGLIVRVI